MGHRLLDKATLIAALLCLAGLFTPISASAADSDGDGIDDGIDNCPYVTNTDQKNWDGDTWDGIHTDRGGDVCDTDDDNDGVPDTSDAFPHDASESADNDKDGIGDNADTDDDNDGKLDEGTTPDNCQFTANADQQDLDKDGKGNLCDDDIDGDDWRHPGITDAFPYDANEWSDRDGDGTGDNRDTDNDNDGKPDTDSNPAMADDDDDNDGVNDFADPPKNTIVLDNCHWVANKDQKDTDSDWDPNDPNNPSKGGDACDNDDDADGHPDSQDDLPTIPSQWQDRDHDGYGDITAAAYGDKFPDNPAEWADNDGDGDGGNSDLNDDYGDNRDPDDDDDGIPDLVEKKYVPNGMDPLVNDSSGDSDTDTFSNLAEYRAGSSPTNPSDTPATRKPAQFKMVTKFGTSGEMMGSSVAILGTKALIGAPNGHLNSTYLGNARFSSTYLGGAHLYTLNGSDWQQDKNFVPINSNHTGLGRAVALADNGNMALISADGINNRGAVYVYTLSGGVWSNTQTLTAADQSGGITNDGQRFGNGIVVSGTTALISAPGTWLNSSGGSAAGAVYVYTLSGGVWSYEATLRSSDKAVQDFFGSSIALQGNRAVVGADGVSNRGANTGAVYIFNRSGSIWDSGIKLQNANTTGGHQFGASVALSNNGNTLVVGATGVSGSGANSGAAYVCTFDGANWDLCSTPLTAPDAAAQLYFGYSAAVKGNDTLVIGTPYASGQTTSNSGGAYIYRLNGGVWRFTGKLQSHDRQTGDFFGHSLTYDSTGGILLAGAPGVDDNGDGAGAAYIVDLANFDTDGINTDDNDGDYIADAFDNCRDNSNADQADLDGDGIGDVCDTDKDGDGIANGSDAFPNDASESLDTDGDGMGDTLDPDADDDGIPDRIEHAAGLNWLIDDAADNKDTDGVTNLDEYIATTGINDPNDKPINLKATYKKLITKDGALNDAFGISAAISGNYAIFGAVNAKANNIDGGGAYIFKWDGSKWAQQQKLAASDAASLAKFGSSVAILDGDPAVDGGEFAIVGAPGASVSGYSNAGAIYLFNFDGAAWNQIAKLTTSAPGTNHHFGASVAIGSATRIVVGAPGAHKNDYLANSGAAYVFDFNGATWSETKKLTGSDSKGNDAFGTSVAVASNVAEEGDWVVLVGSPYADAINYATGAVYRFDAKNNWSETKLTASDGVNGDQFGSSLSFVALAPQVVALPPVGTTRINLGAALIGAPGRDDRGANSGAAYLFDYAFDSNPLTPLSSDPTWRQSAKFIASDGAKSDSFGKNVALTMSVDSGGNRSAAALVGAQDHDGKNIDGGAAYLFTQAVGLGWVQQRPLSLNNGMSYDHFGSSIAIGIDPAATDKKRLLIGASGVDDNDYDAGAAFVVAYDETDDDKDGVYDSFDNCPVINPNQADTDLDGKIWDQDHPDQGGDACDNDIDGDGYLNGRDVLAIYPAAAYPDLFSTGPDAFSFNSRENRDSDGDGIGDNAETDADNDGIPDEVEKKNGLNPQNPADALLDKDSDGLTNLQEYELHTDISLFDTDFDDYSDGEEIYYGKEPNNTSVTPKEIIDHQPKQPKIKAIVPYDNLPLTSLTFDSNPFEDKLANEEGVTDFLTESEWQIDETNNFDDKSGRVLLRNLSEATSKDDEETMRKLILSQGVLLPGKSYWIRTRHKDNKYWSKWSDMKDDVGVLPDPVKFTVTTEGDHFATYNGIDDRYYAGGKGFDANRDGTIDLGEEKIHAIYNTGDSSIIGVRLLYGYFKQLTAIPYSELPSDLTADGRMPYGLFNFRIEGLEVDELDPDRITVTLYLPSTPQWTATWRMYDPTKHTLKEMGTRAEVIESQVSVTLTDGGDLDADGVVNGVIVNTSGLYIPITDEEKLAKYEAGAVSPLALLGLLLCWPLRRAMRRRVK